MRRRKRKFDKGAWELQRERCRITDAEPPLPEKCSTIREVLAGVLQRTGLGERVWEAELQEEWPQLVGAGVAAHCRPGRYHEGVVVVFVDSSVWLQELSRASRPVMLRNLQERFGRRIRDIRLEIDPDGGR